jgi:hypothetical protein
LRLEDQMVFPVEAKVSPYVVPLVTGWLQDAWDPNLTGKNKDGIVRAAPTLDHVHAGLLVSSVGVRRVHIR